ncbi:glycerophosphoryl diester phosphodiesterase membrane domain-containing protein [Companilactobacillus kimchiensis]|uniref:Glycerophosphoryl diester phosphodiesterase, membrane domain-containing protein n=1 Tax=Companilactobacillus kimchiensis TaxID=993692 RepID=A0A0R2LG17_9LACO|nr:glycerophosphodiester phosphodiesterase [Companilactobacillus kimchiensis]KRN98773.1 glycerophosphoryl diester phosphodiesterase, membrane domain-containing protein [Companilactobacillus kimchiensis]
MGILAEFREQNRNFWRYFWKYSQIIILIQLIINFILVPILNYLANGIIRLGHVNYISYTNAIFLITKKPMVVIGLIAVLLILLLLVFAQFTLLLVSFQAIKSHANLSWWDYLKNVSKNLFGLPFKAFGFFLLYFLIITPFGSIGMSSSLLNKVKIPEFIIEWLFKEHLPLGILLIIVYAIIFYIGLRWIFVLPMMIFENKDIRDSIRRSWNLTKGRMIYYLGIFAALIIVITVLIGVSTGLLIILQSGFDHISFLKAIDFPMAIINMTAIQLINYLTSIYASGMVVLIILSDTQTNYFYPHKKHRSHKWFWGILGTFVMVSFITYDTMYFNDWLLTPPVTISHRGVDDGNGVQNTVQSLEATAKEKPDYIEMDIQETKDHQFVVFHDNTLKVLAGINKRPSQMTLEELKNTDIHENGKTTKIVSFDDYLNTATRLHQKLLVELKSVPGNKADFVKLFAKKYGKQLLKNKDMVHSLNYNYIEETKDLLPKEHTSYILPFNLFGVPLTNANAFTMEYTTLNSSFVDDAHIQQKKVYAWTANDTESMDRMIFMGTDGVITDNLNTLKKEINVLFNDASYSKRISAYVTQMQDPF